MEQDKYGLLLKPYRVLDLTNEKGFYCGRILGDMGADVIKIEPPGGDPARKKGPFYHDIPHPERNIPWWFFNANKRGITLNIEMPEGKEIFKTLASSADFVFESFPPGYMDKHGLGYQTLSKNNPGLIMTSISPFGQTGPHSDYKATDIVIWAMCGMMFLCGDPERPPVRISAPQSYFFGGLHGAVGSLLAHWHRQMTGEGQFVDVSIQQACVHTAMGVAESWDVLHQYPTRMGAYYFKNRPEPAGSFNRRLIWPCKDGYICMDLVGGLAVGFVESSKALFEMAVNEGMAPASAAEYDWSKMDLFTITQEECNRIEETITPFLLTKTKTELIEAALDKGILLTPLANTEDLIESSQLKSREFWIDVEHPELGETFTYPGAFVKAQEAPLRIRRRAPLIGQHNEDIYLKELGFSKTRLSTLMESGVI